MIFVYFLSSMQHCIAFLLLLLFTSRLRVSRVSHAEPIVGGSSAKLDFSKQFFYPLCLRAF